MKVAFIASHTQSKDLQEYYDRIINVLDERGYEVFAGTLFNKEQIEPYIENQIKREVWYKESMSQIKQCDFVVVEISYPSTANVGHELTYALDLGKPVVAMYLSGRDPLFLRGRVDDKLAIMPYTSHDLEQVLASAFDYALSAQDVRFNFFISPQIGTYLDWISKHKRLPRAVYLRRLIERDMKENKEYNEE